MDESIGTFDHQYRQVTIQLRVTYFLEEDTGHEPSNDGEIRRHSTREEVRVLFQELAVTEQIGEPFRWIRKCAANDGLIQTCQVASNSVVSNKQSDRGDSPQSRADRPSEGLVCIGQGQARCVSDES